MKSQSQIKSEVTQDLAQLAKDKIKPAFADLSEGEATARPWHIGLVSDSDIMDGALSVWADIEHRQPSQIKAGNNASCIALVSPADNTTETDKANAALIVRAVNEHAALVAVAEAAEAFPIMDCNNVIRSEELKSALANLAAVRGESEGVK